MLALEKKRGDLKLLAISFSAVSLIGGIGLFTYWWTQNSIETGVARVALFVAIMAAVHGLCAALYISQDDSRVDSKFRLAKSWTLRGSVRIALIQYLFFILITALILDGGFLFRCFGCGLLAHGFLTVTICLRRPSVPTRLDLGLIRYGYLPVTLFVSLVMTFVVGSP